MITLNESKQYLATRQPFSAGNLTASIEAGELNGEIVPIYVVRSYGVKIATSSPWVNDCGVISGERYSQTTSKHQNIVKRAWGLI